MIAILWRDSVLLGQSICTLGIQFKKSLEIPLPPFITWNQLWVTMALISYGYEDSSTFGLQDIA